MSDQKKYMQPNRKIENKKLEQNTSTSWTPVASWYDEYLKKSGTLQSEVILPNILRMLDLQKGDTVLDIACGQGFFTEHFAESGATVYGTDISKELIMLAEKSAKNKKLSINYRILPAHKAPHMPDMSADIVVVILAFENIENINQVLAEISRVLRPDGRVVIVLMHPAFRIPQESAWGFDTEKNVQHRIIEKYLSEATYKIDMHPGKAGKKHISTGDITLSFHRSLQWYMKAFNKANFKISRLEEWISHKESNIGPRKAAEDRARKEIPMFMCIELKK